MKPVAPSSVSVTAVADAPTRRWPWAVAAFGLGALAAAGVLFNAQTTRAAPVRRGEPPRLRPVAGPPAPVRTAPVADAPRAERTVDVAICLDTSGSMSGLIDAARRKVWDLVTTLAEAKPTPRLRLALLTYGGTENPDGRWVVERCPLTDDLDTVYDRLMALGTNGGEEYVGGVVHHALESLDWSEGPGALRMVFVAGNESADQDRVHDFREVCAAARAASVTVNAIYCGPDDAGDAPSWREVARTGGGEFAAIDPNHTISIETPFDAELSRLSTELNGTYVPYGVNAAAGAANQERQDSGSWSLGSSTAASRAQAKASAAYRNSGWDLVDACEQRDFDWSKVERDTLPEALRGLATAELEAHVAKRKAARTALQGKIKELGKEREAFLREALAKQQGAAERSLDHALLTAVRNQAEAAGFRFE